jgi:hypothetical protein
MIDDLECKFLSIAPLDTHDLSAHVSSRVRIPLGIYEGRLKS